jgi:carboxyl-terminal processing protease
MAQAVSDAPTPVALVEQVLDLIQTKSLKRRELRWETIRPEVLTRARDSDTLEQAHDLIREVLKQLGDNHSFLWTAASKRRLSAPDYAGLRFHQDEPVIIHVSTGSPAAAHGLRQGDRIVAVDGQNVAQAGWRSLLRSALRAGTELVVYRTTLKSKETLTLTEGVELPNLFPHHYLTPEGFGVIDLPGHMGDGALPGGRDYAREVQGHLHQLEAAGARGWVIDLRRNDGGNMWPMLAGLTPLLGATDYGSFFDPVDEVLSTRWTKCGGSGVSTGRGSGVTARTSPRCLMS